MYALSAATGNAFPQLLASLSMAKERYYQSPRDFAYGCNVQIKPVGLVVFFRSF